MTKLFEGARQNWKYVIKSVILAIIFWLVQFFYQYFVLIPGDLNYSLIRSFALTGATLIGIALIIGPLAVLKSSINFIPHRRTIGVLGFAFILMHLSMAITFVYQVNLSIIFYTLNPFVNPVIFGFLAFLFLFLLFITSTDWAVEKLKFKNWKRIHRLVFFAFVFAVMHFIHMNPPILQNPAGYLLLFVTLLVFILEIAAFIKTVMKKKNKKDTLTGLLIILFAIIMFYFGFFVMKIV